MREKNEERSRELLIALLLFIFLLQLLEIGLKNELVPLDPYFFLLETTIHKVRGENMLLTEEILKSESLTVIAEKAKHMGFIPAAVYIYLKQPQEDQKVHTVQVKK